MSVGTVELAPPNEGGDDRDPDVMQARLEEMLGGEYVSLDDQEIEDFLKDADEEDSTAHSTSIEERPHLAPERQTSEQFEFTEIEVGQRGLNRRYRQAGLGIHAGYLSLQRSMPRIVRTLPDGTKEFAFGNDDSIQAYARTMSVLGADRLKRKDS
jgi:hypothetical protein